MERYIHLRAINKRLDIAYREIVLKPNNPFYSKGYERVMEILFFNLSGEQTMQIVLPVLKSAKDMVEYLVNLVVFMELELVGRVFALFDKESRVHLHEKINGLMNVPSDCKTPEEDTLENKCINMRTWSLEEQKRFFANRMRSYVSISSEITLALLDE
jgi:hypothetical protein